MEYLKAIVPCMLICANAGAANEVPVQVELPTDRVAHEVSPTLHGIFFEDINYDRVARYSRSGAGARDNVDERRSAGREQLRHSVQSARPGINDSFGHAVNINSTPSYNARASCSPGTGSLRC